MTDISFHINAADKLAYTCRLLRKAVTGGAKLIVTGPADVLDQLDHDLWTFGTAEFVPHCRLDDKATILQKSPVVLTQAVHSAPFQSILINLGDQIPNGFDQFERVIEVVSLDDEDRRLARQRWRHYAGAGFSLVKHDLEQKARS